MTDKYIEVLVKFPDGIANPIVTGSRRLTLLNLSKFLWGLAHGSLYKQGSTTITVADTLVAASATCTPATVTNGQTVTIAGTALTATQHRSKGTITCASALAAQTVTINGTVFTAVSGAATLGDATFSIDTGNTETATSLAAQINAYGGSTVNGLVAAKSAAGVVTVYAVTPGTAGDSLTLASSDGGTLAVSGATLTGGAAIANNQFDFIGTNVTTGAALAYAINNSTTAAIKRVTATSSSSTGVVTITAKIGGDAGEAITLTSSDGATLAVTGSGFLASGSQGEPTQWTT